MLKRNIALAALVAFALAMVACDDAPESGRSMRAASDDLGRGEGGEGGTHQDTEPARLCATGHVRDQLTDHNSTIRGLKANGELITEHRPRVRVGQDAGNYPTENRD